MEGPWTVSYLGEPSLKYNSSDPNTTVTDVSEYNWPFLFLIPIIFFTTLGNILVCIAVLRVPKLQTVNNIFLMSLAVADLMVAVLVMPLGLIKDFYGFWPSSPFLCSIWNTLDVLCCTASILHISVISLDRYLAICDPIRYSQKRRKKSRAVCKILLVWLMSIALSSPLLILAMVGQEGIVDDEYCIIRSLHFKIYGSVIAFFFPLSIVVVSYMLTAFTLHRKSRLYAKMKKLASGQKAQAGHDKRQSLVANTQNGVINKSGGDKNTSTEFGKQEKGTQRQHRKESQRLDRRYSSNEYYSLRRSRHKERGKMSSNEQKANQVLFLIFVIFVLAWTPFFTVNILFSFCTNCKGTHLLFTLLTWLGWMSSMVNPVIYTIFNSDFRLAFWCILTCKWRQYKTQTMTTITQVQSFTALRQTSHTSESGGCQTGSLPSRSNFKCSLIKEEAD